MELAHIALGHHIDTRYAFNDRLLFPDESTFQRIDMNHSDHDNPKPQARPRSTCDASMYKDQARHGWPVLGTAWPVAVQVLKALNTPKLGDSLLKADGTPWMADPGPQAPEDQLGRPGADSRAASGKLAEDRSLGRPGPQLNAKLYAPMNARDKMPLEVTPVYFKLQRYDEAQSQAANAAAKAAPGPIPS